MQKDVSILLIWLMCAVAGAMIGSSKGETATGFVLGLLFGPFGMLFILVDERKPQDLSTL
jgi:hypothetical protein